MKNLLKLELRKLAKQKSLYICTGIILAMLLISAITFKIASNFNISDPEISALLNPDGIKFFLMSIDSGNFTIILAITIAITYCYDFEEGTIKNIFARGYSRSSLYFSKITSILTSTTLMFIITLAFGLLFGWLFFGFTADISVGKVLALVGIQYILVIAYALFFVLVSSLLKKVGGAIAVNIVAPLIITLILALIDQIIKINGFTFTEMWITPMLASTELPTIDTGRMIVCLVSGVVYSIVFIILGALISKKVEI